MEIKGSIIYPDTKNVEYVNGAFGSLNNHGEFLIHFFKDVNNLPKELTVSIENGKAPKDIFNNDNGFTRNVVSSIILSPEVAKGIAEWMLNNINQIKLLESSKVHKE